MGIGAGEDGTARLVVVAFLAVGVRDVGRIEVIGVCDWRGEDCFEQRLDRVVVVECPYHVGGPENGAAGCLLQRTGVPALAGDVYLLVTCLACALAIERSGLFRVRRVTPVREAAR